MISNDLCKKILLSLVIFISIFFLGFQLKNAGVDCDDYGTILNSRFTNFKEFKNQFKGEHFAYISFPSNFKESHHSFMNALYRPLFRVTLGVQLGAFGFTPFLFLLILFLFHALNSILLFFIMSRFTSNFWSFLFALYFAFHNATSNFLGWISAQNYAISFFCGLVAIILFFKYLQNNRVLVFIISAIFYIASFLLLEQTIFLPIFISGLIFIKDFLIKYFGYFNFDKKEYLLKTLPFWVITALYFLWRIFLFGIYSSAKLPFLQFVKSYYYPNFATFVFEAINLKFIPGGNFLLKFYLLFLVLALLFYLFIKSKEKRTILFFSFIFVISIWTMFITTYMPRNFYFGLPFLIFIIYLLIKPYEKQLLLKIFFLFLILFNMNILYSKLNRNRIAILSKFNSLKKIGFLIKDLNKPVFFIANSSTSLASLINPIRIYNFNKKLPHYWDNNVAINNYSSKTNVLIDPIKNGFRLTVDSAKGNFVSGSSALKMGKIRDLKFDSNNNVIAREYIFDDEYLKQDMIFIAFDFEKNEYFILDKKPIL